MAIVPLALVVASALSGGILAIESPRLHAVIVGINQYDNHDDLLGAAADASAFYGLMTTMPGHILEEADAKLLAPVATLEDLRRALRETAGRMKPKDTLLFYYSGHSGNVIDSRSGERFNLMASDARIEGTGVLVGGFDIIAELNDVSAQLRGCDVILIIDGCETPATSIAGNEIPGVELTAMVATRPDEVASELPARGKVARGVFSLALDESLRAQKGDVNQDGLLSVDELFLQAYPTCVRLCLLNRMRNQYPSLAGTRTHKQYLCRAPGLERDVAFVGGIPASLRQDSEIHVNQKVFFVREVDADGDRVRLSTEDGTLPDGFVEFNRDGTRRLYWLSADTLSPVDSLPAPEKSHAVIISPGKHYGAIRKLELPGMTDVARQLGAALKRVGFGQITDFLEQDAKSQEIRRYVLETFTRPDQPEIDRLLIIFLGHGQLDPQNGRLSFLITADYDEQRPVTTSLQLSHLMNWMDVIRAKHVMCVVDACQAGTGDLREAEGQVTSLTATKATTANSLFQWRTTKSRCLITSTYRGQDANPVEQGAGVAEGAGLFASEFLSALQGAADRYGDGVITTTELYDHCALKVQKLLDERKRKDPQVPPPHQEVSVVWQHPGGGDEPPESQMFFVLPIAAY